MAIGIRGSNGISSAITMDGTDVLTINDSTGAVSNITAPTGSKDTKLATTEFVSNEKIYNAGRTYELNEPTFFYGIPYRSLQAGNINHTPNGNPVWWEATGGGEAVLLAGKLTWNSGTDTYSNHFVDTTRIFDKIRRCLLASDGTVNYYLDPNNSALKANGTASILTGADGNVMVEIPAFYIKTTFEGINENKICTWEITDTPTVDFTLHPAFIRNGIQVNKRYVSAYGACVNTTGSTYESGLNWDDNVGTGRNWNTATAKLASVSSIYPACGITRAEARQMSSNVGANWSVVDFYLVSAIQLLALVELGTFNLQTAIGQGNTRHTVWPASSGVQSDTRANIAGLSNSLGNRTGGSAMGTINTFNNGDFMSYRGIENFFGNVWNFVDGINVSDLQVYVSNSPTQFADDTITNYSKLGTLLPASNNYIRDIQSLSGVFLPSSVTGGSSSSFITDYFYQTTGWRVLLLGGGGNNGLDAGAWYLTVSNASSVLARYIGARVCC